MTALTRTPLFGEHLELAARFTDFHGWEMPLKYGSELAEHHAVRQAAGLFDLSHMGEIFVEGADAAVLMNSVLVGDFAALAVGRAKYSLLLHEGGGIVDDLIGYRLAADRFLLVPNAGNTVFVREAFEAVAAQLQRGGLAATVRDASVDTGVVALQGPRAAQILTRLVEVDAEAERAESGGGDGSDAANGPPPARAVDAGGSMSELRSFGVAEATICGAPVLVARTGYTGEDGFELYVPNDAMVRVWRALLEVGEPFGLVPAGLAARDSLRLEAGLVLYGNELSRDTTPVEVGLGGVVSFTKPESFPGRAALEAAGEPGRVLVGLVGLGRRAGRAGTEVRAGDESVGRITSGQPSPTLGTPVALALIDRVHSAVGTKLDIDLRGTRHQVIVAQLPFVRRGESAAPETNTTTEPAKEQDHE